MADRVDLAFAQRLAENATPGPWQFNPGNGVHTKLGFCVALTHNDENKRTDAEFIAACRSLVPALVAELVGLREATNRIRQRCESQLTRADGPHLDDAYQLALDLLAILDGDPK